MDSQKRETTAKLTLTFHGGAETVTGANFLLSAAEEGKSILIDCGLFQGKRVALRRNRERFPYDPSQIEALFVTHAHLDHIGRIPYLIRAGFRGRIYSTPPTKEMAGLSLIDSLGVLKKESARDKLPLLYTETDVREAMGRWQTLNYGEPLELGGFSITLRDAAHILGSAMVEITYRGRKILFTGDLGNSPTPLLGEINFPKGINYLVMESVYGDREHESREEAIRKMEDVIEETMHHGGTLLIPAFSIERTQELLYEMEKMMEHSRIPLVPVFLDSPLAIGMTKIYKQYASYLKVKDDNDLFLFPQLQKTLKTEDSKKIDLLPQRKIIIAGSGMSNGGRIIHHEKRFLPDPKTTLLLVGYQPAGSLGRLLQEGARSVTILGEKVPVRARVTSLHGFSAHLGGSGLLEFVARTADTLKEVFVTMGEPRSSLHLAQKIKDYLGISARVPSLGEQTELEF